MAFAFGDLEINIRPSWLVSYDESVPVQCLPPQGQGLVVFTSPSPGNPPAPACGAGAATTTVVVWYPADASLSGAPQRTVHGVALRGPLHRGDWSEYSAPAQHYVFYVKGPQGTATLGTLSYSARAALAHLTPAPAVPRSWKRVAADGLSFAVPASWPVRHWSAGPSYTNGGPQWDLPGTAVIYSGGQASVLHAAYFASASGLAADEYQDFWGDGLVLSHPALAPLGPSAMWGIAPRSHTCAHPHGLTICPAPGDNTLYGAALFTVKRPGSKQVDSITVGLQGNGSVAKTIIGSFAPA